MAPPSPSGTGAGGYIYPGPRSSRAQMITALAWSGLLGIIMVVGLVIDKGWIGRIGALVVLAALVVPQWIRVIPLVRATRPQSTGPR